MLGIFADNSDNPFSLNDLTFITNLLHGSPDFHFTSLPYFPLYVMRPLVKS